MLKMKIERLRERRMRHIALGLVLVLVAVAAGCRHREEKSSNGSVTKDFVSGGNAQITLESGSYDVKAGTDNRVHVEWTGEGDKEARVTVTVNGTSAEVKAENTPEHFHATIELPANTNLRVDLSAGELNVTGVKGNKEIDAKAGNVTINVGKNSDWWIVEASVQAGNLEAPAFQSNQSGLLRSLHWNGPGKYRLHVNLEAGNLRLVS
jgi:hypothetical protein